METTSTSFISASLSTIATQFSSLALKLFFIVIFVIIVLYFSRKFIAYFQQTIKEHNSYEENSVSFSNIIGDVFFYLVLLFSVCIGLYITGFKSTYIILGATFATGYAFKELFQSVIAGLLIMTTKEFVPGDLIEVYIDDIVHFGKIESITIRYTVLRRLDMTRVVIPNRLLTRIPVMTFGAEDNVRLHTTFKLKASTDLHAYIPGMRQVIMNLESITEKDFTLITLDGSSYGSLLLTAYFYFDPLAGKLRFRVISEVNMSLAEFFKENNIVFAYDHAVYTFDAQDQSLPDVVDQYTSLLPSSH